jgi:hypothetical protein
MQVFPGQLVPSKRSAVAGVGQGKNTVCAPLRASAVKYFQHRIEPNKLLASTKNGQNFYFLFSHFVSIPLNL